MAQAADREHTRALWKQIEKQINVSATFMGYIGGGNFHDIFAVDPDSLEELQQVVEINSRS
ncbi:hypothetical protein [Halotalea alkalilenta]|uniref:Uncharacterized protein n=1 Tax=Halotalea alkalilenta TaxID=376489 RepID=A0A172YJE6_9GAMM|nr:hypothetical protein [Halotalea alkalilenta]ANF59296.1 hypothetical protein A5892_19065 [Halotalea alkalilenta]